MNYVENIRRKIGHDPLILVGSNVIIEKDGKILLQKRSNGNWGLPGGLMEIGETLEHTAVREVYEESNLEISNLKLINLYSGNDYSFTLKNNDQINVVTALYYTNQFEGVMNTNNEETLDLKFVDPKELPFETEQEYVTYINDYIKKVEKFS
ncbi:NUDIX domain-containing protein [Mammaliicoccus sciuri]|uniref:NUDIX domain-containing protein n=1 Tax=Mammaliicoccus sciuri TaxID=1296 RepID=A0AAJ4VJ77_MAMSC|nr:NUDIX domain-containing protein [Mammaliicoccus sciuri]RTX75195.1 NUDIX domain-containing protein [Mammaliicoccus sciuri]